MNAKVKGTAFALFGGACWGLSSVVGKLLFDMRGMNAEWLVTARLVFGGFIMLCFAAFQKKGEIFKIWKEKKTAFSMILFAALGMLACQLTYFLCVQYSNPATATVLQYTSPVMIMLLCLFLDRKLPRIIDIIVLIAVVVGVFLMSTHGNIHSLAISQKALILGITTAITVVFYTVWPVRLLREYGSTLVIGWGMFIGGIMLMPFSKFWAPLYFRTTEEMLEEFAYLGEAKAKEVVITNTNKIADMIEKISPVHPDKCPPVIPKSDETLTKICYDKAHEIYGPDLPDIVEERLQRELNSIISNGFAVMYIIAQKLVWDSNDHGYLVGSRGSVGSSFVATMAGITEVNPLSAHYICPKCHYVDFDSDAVRPYSKKGMSGCDMPDRDCPVCGTPLQKEGHDIPFETFLGFKGNKEPDIDLNFSGEYQSKAHKYVEVIFGEGKAFRAGTIGTLAEKTAYGYVYKYFEERDIHKRRCEMERLAEGCTGVKRTTGQHPGGIIVVPHEHEIYEFTAIQQMM